MRLASIACGLAGSAALFALAWLTPSCGSFGTAEGPSDGGAGEPAKAREFTIALELPSVAALDPYGARAAAVAIVVTDAADASRTRRVEVPSADRGPFTIAGFVTSPTVDATVEVRDASGRLVGYGERRSAEIGTSSLVQVAVRKRLVFFTSRDRGDVGQLRVFDLGAAEVAEGGLAELVAAPLQTLSEPRGLYATADGRHLVEAGEVSSGSGALAVFDSGTHARKSVIPLPFVPGMLVPVEDGTRAVVAPEGATGDTVFALVDVVKGELRSIPSGVQGGTLRAGEGAASPDGARVAVVGDHRASSWSDPKAFLFVLAFEPGRHDPVASALDLSPHVESARGVRFSPDGARIYVSGRSGDSGFVLEIDAAAPAGSAPRKIALEAGRSAASTLLLHPDGRHAYVNNDTQYGTTACCGGVRIVDLTSGAETYAAPMRSGPEYEISSAVLLPYAPPRVLAGQSDNGNNDHGAFVDLTSPGGAPPEVAYEQADDIGSAEHLVTFFGRSL